MHAVPRGHRVDVAGGGGGPPGGGRGGREGDAVRGVPKGGGGADICAGGGPPPRRPRASCPPLPPARGRRRLADPGPDPPFPPRDRAPHRCAARRRPGSGGMSFNLVMAKDYVQIAGGIAGVLAMVTFFIGLRNRRGNETTPWLGAQF